MKFCQNPLNLKSVVSILSKLYFMELICKIEKQISTEMRAFWMLRNLGSFAQEELRIQTEEER